MVDADGKYETLRFVSERQEGRRGARQLLYGLACSGALHGAILVAASFGSCLSAVAPTQSVARDSLVGVEISPPAVAPAAPPEPASSRPGGGVPTHHSRQRRPPARGVTGPRAAPVEQAVIAPALLAEATADDSVDVPAAAPSDSEAPTAPQARSPDAGTVSAVSSATPPAYGTGRGLGGGTGGGGHGPGGARLPVVARKFALGGDTGDFKAVVCFILPGTLRIADVHRCDPVAVFYTDTFDIPERQFADGFPGITDRSNWFMVDYRGSFSARQEGDYRFRLHSDDGAYLYIDGSMVIENDGKHEPMSRSGSVHLGRGRHQLKLLYAQTVDRMALQLFVRVPGAWSEKLFRSEL
jgi:hypothetical protein